VLIRRSNFRKPQARNGWLAPIMALVLFVMLGLFALVLDRLWLDMASAEAQGVAESAALAAARELVSDDLLKIPAPDPEDRIERAKGAAINVASLNNVAGQPMLLDADQGDIRFGTNLTVEDTGEVLFVESNFEVHSVRVVAQRTRARRNPVALFFGGLTKLPEGDVGAMAEATIANQIIGLQTVGGARIPALPLAILARAPAGSTLPTWHDQIELRRGADRYSYDSVGQTVVSIQDGIPEIILTAPGTGSEITTSNMRLFCVHGQQDGTSFEDQIRLGWGDQHLTQRDGRILTTNGPEYFPAAKSVPSGCLVALKEMIGQCRVVMLFQDEWDTQNSGWGRIQSAGLVAGRIMAVIEENGQSPQIVFQPAVLATRCAMLASDLNDPGATAVVSGTASGAASSATASGSSSQAATANKYIYQFKLTQ
jgi:hypothetical protein